MSKKTDHQIDGFFDYVVPPLEGFWWQEGINGIDYSHKEDFCWIALIRLPDFVTKADFDWAVEEAIRKKENRLFQGGVYDLSRGLVRTVYAHRFLR